MEMNKARITRINRDGNDKVNLILSVNDRDLEIPLTEDDPKTVKEVFNELIKELKKGEFNFELEDSEEDLYYHICEEYINQLNSELSSIYSELEDRELLEKVDES